MAKNRETNPLYSILVNRSEHMTSNFREASDIQIRLLRTGKNFLDMTYETYRLLEQIVEGMEYSSLCTVSELTAKNGSSFIRIKLSKPEL